MLSPLPRRSGWAYCFAHLTQPYQPSPKGSVGSACASSFSRLARRSLALRPAHSRCHRIRDTLSEGFSHFVTSMTAPVASGWSGCRVGLAPTGKRRLFTAHAKSGLSASLACPVSLFRYTPPAKWRDASSIFALGRNCCAAVINSAAGLWFPGGDRPITARGRCMAGGRHNIERRNYCSMASRHRELVGAGPRSVHVPAGLFTINCSKFQQSALQ